MTEPGASSGDAHPPDDNAKEINKPDVSSEKNASEKEQKLDADEQEILRFPPEQEAELLAESNGHKDEANKLFGRGQFDNSLTSYESALAVLPNYLDYDQAVLHANMAACHLKLEAWKEAIRSATLALETLDKAGEKEKKERENTETTGKGGNEALAAQEAKTQEAMTTEIKETAEQANQEGEEEEEADEEIVSEGAAKAARPPPPPPKPKPAPAVVLTPAEKRNRLRAKVLLRRARARSEQGGWANLSGAEEDYKSLLALAKSGKSAPPLAAADRRLAETQLRLLPARTKAAQEAEMGEMWGKLKELGNGLLGNFGLSTDNFQMVKDEKTGGYSMNFKS